MMIQDDVAIFNQILLVISSGIVEGYDAFTLEIAVGEGYVDRSVEVEVDGKKSTDAADNVDGVELVYLVKQLLANAKIRNEPWRKFVMSYRRGGKVNVSFEYGVDDAYCLSV